MLIPPGLAIHLLSHFALLLALALARACALACAAIIAADEAPAHTAVPQHPHSRCYVYCNDLHASRECANKTCRGNDAQVHLFPGGVMSSLNMQDVSYHHC